MINESEMEEEFPNVSEEKIRKMVWKAYGIRGLGFQSFMFSLKITSAIIVFIVVLSIGLKIASEFIPFFVVSTIPLTILGSFDLSCFIAMTGGATIMFFSAWGTIYFFGEI